MASTWSDLKIELITTGEQSGTWGDTTNSNLGTALEQAIVGQASVTFSSGDITLTLSNSKLFTRRTSTKVIPNRNNRWIS